MAHPDEVATVALGYAEYRANFAGICDIPHWDDLHSWQRETLYAAYLQGKIDGLNDRIGRNPPRAA